MADLFRRYRVKAGWVLLIVRNSPELPVVLGNFFSGPPSPGFLEKNGLVPLMLTQIHEGKNIIMQ